MRALAHDAVVVRRAGGLEVHGGGLAEVVEPVQHVLVFLRRDHLIGQTRGPAHGHQQEDMPRRRADALAKFEYLLEVVQVVAGDRGVDLELHALGLEAFDAAHGGVERAGHAAEGVMRLGVVAVDGNGATLHARFPDLAGRLRGDQRAVGRHDAAQALGRGVGHQLVDIGAHHGIAARKDDDRIAHAREGVDQGLGLFGGQFAGIGLGVRLGPAVLAGQIAGAGHFPRDETADRGTVLQRPGPAHTGMASGMSLRRMGSRFRHPGMPGGVPFLSHAARRLVADHRTHPFFNASSAK